MRALIAGLGLIGGSLAMALRARGWDVAFVDPRVSAREASERGAGEEKFESIADALRSAAAPDLVVLATPVDAAVAMLPSIHAPLVTSVCSVMGPLRRIGGENFVAGHPLAGAANSGLAAARADLFAGAKWFVDRENSTVERMVRDCGASPELVEAETHDRALALTSHLPQLLSTALAAASPDPRFAGPGLATFLRLAESDASVWGPLLDANRENVRAALDEVLAIARDIVEGDRDAFSKAQEWMRRLRAGS
jgi:prephenate dehydrogenase